MTWLRKKSRPTGWKPEDALFRLSIPCLILGLLSGCRPAPPVPSSPKPPVPPLRPGSVDVGQYLRLHPAAAQLRGLKASLAALQEPAVAVTLEPLEAPTPMDLTSLAPLDAPGPADLHPNRERARSILREEFTYRRLAQPDRFEDRYQAELERLRRRYLEARIDLPEIETQPQLVDAARRAREMDRLERRIRELDDPPARRALLSLEEIKERRSQREQAQRALEELRREEIRRLRDALTVPRRRPLGEPEIPAAALARIERERSEGRVAADLQLVQEEQKALARLEQELLPAPAVGDPNPMAPAPEPPLPAPASRLATPPPTPRAPTAPSVQSTRSALAVEYRALTQAILRDLLVVSREAARRQGIELHPRSAGSPDRTLELMPAVRQLLGKSASDRSRRPGRAGAAKRTGIAGRRKEGNDE